jgi:hypothetical protein
MRQVSYNRLKNARIKQISLGTILILTICLTLSIVSIRTADSKPTSTFYTLLFSFGIPGLVILIGLIPFGQVIETLDNKKFATFYKLGRLKFKYQTWDKADPVTLEQDQRKFYCLTIKTADGQTLLMEKYPTLDQADERLKEFKKLFD